MNKCGTDIFPDIFTPGKIYVQNYNSSVSGQPNVIYIDQSTGLQYYWTGTQYKTFTQFPYVNTIADLPLPPSDYLGQVWLVLDDSSLYVIDGATWNELSGAGGSVTSISVANANGFFGSVANPTTTPEISISISDSDIVRTSLGLAEDDDVIFNSVSALGDSYIAFNHFANLGLNILDTDASNYLIIKPNSNLTANRTLSIVTGDADRSLSILGDSVINQNVSTTGSPTFDDITATDTIIGNILGIAGNAALGSATIANLTVSQLVATDASKNLISGNLSGDVTSYALTTSILSTVVTGKVLTGFSVGSNTAIIATDTILQAFDKTQGQINAISGGYVTSIAGTANQIIASASTGAITLSTPQNIDAAAAVTFGTIQITGASSPTGTATINSITNAISTAAAGVFTGLNISPTFTTSRAGINATVRNTTLNPTFSPQTGNTVANAYNLHLQGGVQSGAGTINNGYTLYVSAPSFGTNKYALYTQDLVIAYGVPAPANGAIISGTVGIGTSSPSSASILNLGAGSTSKAPLVINSSGGNVLSSALSGAIENDGSFLYYTDSTPARRTLVTIDNTQTLTNKLISGSANTFSNIPNSATTATDANTPSTIVARDASGNFIAGTITATLSGNAATATTSANITTANEAADATCFLAFVTTSGTQSSIPVKTNTGLIYNSSTNEVGLTNLAATGTIFATSTAAKPIGIQIDCTGNSGTGGVLRINATGSSGIGHINIVASVGSTTPSIRFTNDASNTGTIGIFGSNQTTPNDLFVSVGTAAAFGRLRRQNSDILIWGDYSTSGFGQRIQLPDLTASRILATSSISTVEALDTATYPSLTELAFIKGQNQTVNTTSSVTHSSITTTTATTTNFTLNSTPAYAIRASGQIFMTTNNNIAATYSRTGTLVTITVPGGHTFRTGHRASLDFTTGTAVDGLYDVTAVSSTIFTVTTVASGATSGNVTILQLTIGGGFGIQSVADAGVGLMIVNWTTQAPTAAYAAQINVQADVANVVTIWGVLSAASAQNVNYCPFRLANGSNTGTDFSVVNITMSYN